MKKKTAGSRRFIITKNLIMMLVMLVVIFVAIFAWYSNVDSVTASETTISAKGADNVELAVPQKVKVGDDTYDSFPVNNDDWDTEINFADSGYLKNLVKDITSGGQQFVVPNFEAAKSLKDGRKVIANDVWTDGISSKEALLSESTVDDDQYNYISLDFYVRAKSPSINVTAESFLAAGSEMGYQDAEHPSPDNDDPNKRSEGAKPLVNPGSGATIYRTSSYGKAEGAAGSFSSDAIIGAMRVSLVGAPVDGVTTSGGVTTETAYGGHTVGPNSDAWGDAAQLSFLWLPRPDIHLNTSDNSDNWTLTTGIASSGNLADETYCHSFYVGNTVDGTSVKKGLTHTIYYDTAAHTPSDTTGMTNPEYFYVSNGTTTLSTNVSCPSLGRSAKVADNAPDTSAQIQFTQGTGNKADNDTTGYYVYKYTLNIWIEGEDAEARRSMNDGVFTLEIDFGT